MRKQGKSFCCLILLVMLLLSGPSIVAGSINSRAGTSAFSFLKINIGARPVAMGGAFTGLADDENALYYNPAGIALLDRHGVIFGYHNYFLDLQSGLVGYVHQFNETRYLAGHIYYLNYGDFIEANNLGDSLGVFGGSDIAVAATFAMRRSEDLYIGVTAKLIYEKIQVYSASGIAFDFGLRYQSSRGRYMAGMMLQNVGAQLSNFTDVAKDGLPTTLRFGAAARPRGLPILFSGDLILPTDNNVEIAIGGEYYEFKPLYLRLGWNGFGSNSRATDSDDKWAGVSVGFGIDWRNLQLSYAYAPGAELGESHRITLTGGL